MPEQACWTATAICGNSVYFTDDRGDIRILDVVPPRTLCLWSLDLRDQVNLSQRDYLLLNITISDRTALRGKAVVAAYTIYSHEAYPKLKSYVPVMYITSEENGGITNSVKANYMYSSPSEIAYWTGAVSDLSAGLRITWSAESPNSVLIDDSTGIVTIVAVTVVSVVCCACVVACGYKLLRRVRRHRIYMDRGEFAMLFQDRMSQRRVYNMVPVRANMPAAYVTQENIDRCLPCAQFDTTQLEVGHPTCAICFEEYQ